MASICRFKPVSSSTTGFRAASASSAFLVKPAFSVSQSACSLLKVSFNFSLVARALVSSSLALEASACWDFSSLEDQRFEHPSYSARPTKARICQQQDMYFLSTKRITSYALRTWGLMPICSIINTYFLSLKNNSSIILDTWGLMYICSKRTHGFKTRITSHS